MIAVSSRTSQSDLNWTLKRISKTETAVKLKSRFKCTKVSTLLVSLASIMCVLLLIPLYIIPKDSAESTYSNFRNAGALVNDITALQPDLSVIVLTYNGAGRIADIVHSLVACGSSWAVEIIIVDNGCSSDVILMLHQLRIMKMNASLRYLALCDNEAYSVANNIGARASVPESRWLLFLNDDVLPSKGFLNNLKATVHVAIARGIKIGGVGGKLLFGDGKVIEAGSLIRSDGSTDNFYRGGQACNPQVSFVRHVHYVSGACLLANKTAFSAANGFRSEIYEAYYEDTHLQMHFRHIQGLEILYSPFSVATHAEHATFGSNKSKQLMKISFQQFRSIWIDQLSAHHPVFDNQPLLPVLSEEAIANGQWSDRLLSRDTRAGDAISSRVYIILTAAEMMLSLSNHSYQVHMSRLLAHLQWLFANDHDFSVNISTSDVGIKALRLLEMCGIEIIVAMALQGSVLDKEVKCYSSEASFNSKKFDCERHIYLFDEFAVRDCSNADFAYVSWTSVLKERAGYYDIIIMGADALVACAEALPNRPSGNDHMSKLLKKYGSMQNQKKELPRGFGKLLLDETTRSLEWKCQVEAHEISGEFFNMLPSFLRRFDSLHHGDYLYSIETSIRKLLVEGGSPLKKTDGPDIPKDAILSYLRQSKCPMTLVLSVVPGYQQSKYAANFSHRDIYLDMHLSDAPNYIHSCALAEAVDLWKKLVDVNQGVNRSDYEDAIFLAMENINA